MLEQNALSKSLVMNMTAAIDAVRFDKNVRVVIIRSHVKGASPSIFTLTVGDNMPGF